MSHHAGTTACFVGRFQPFHLGHYFALLQIAANPRIKEIKIGIGNAEVAAPFNFKIRKRFITSIRLPKNKKLTIYPIKDSEFTGNPAQDLRWVRTLDRAVGKFDICYGNAVVRRALVKKGYKAGKFSKL